MAGFWIALRLWFFAFSIVVAYVWGAQFALRPRQTVKDVYNGVRDLLRRFKRKELPKRRVYTVESSDGKKEKGEIKTAEFEEIS